MAYEINITIQVDKDANFLEISGDNCDVIKELITLSLYDIDDINVTECEVTNRD
jgi:hypothetical protein|tara:strand:- start:19 stop:180 length:162 start_codon:yes stop_codon:yes gene_type:complete